MYTKQSSKCGFNQKSSLIQASRKCFLLYLFVWIPFYSCYININKHLLFSPSKPLVLFAPDTRTLRWQTSNVGSFLRRNQGILADQKPTKKWPESDLSNEQKPSLFRVYRGWDTTRLCGDYQKPLSEFLLNNQYLMESKKGFFRGSPEIGMGKKHLQNQQMSP